MDIPTVKQKLPLFLIPIFIAVLTFVASWAQLFPSKMVERVYSRRVFPLISRLSSLMANAIPFSWLDVWIPVAIALLIYSVYRRRWRLPVVVVSLAYLWFFWGWGLNYHRPPVAERLHLVRSTADADFDKFTDTAVAEINRLWPLASAAPLDRQTIGAIASKRVERVVFKIDGTDWQAARKVKRSLLAEPWWRGAGIDGMFNPFGQEPLVIAGPYPFELPFLMSHEIAHVRGVANEGEANLIALLATVASEDPRFQYSGWLYLWGYLHNAPTSRLDPGPRADLRASAERILSHRIRLVTNFQSALLDAHLKANAVPGGIQSYSDFVALAIASQPRWKDFQ
jgi:Protein of unknown function (DUF3810)